MQDDVETKPELTAHHLIVLGKPGHPTTIVEYYTEEDVMQAFIQECQSFGVEPAEMELTKGRFECPDGTIIAVSYNTITKDDNGPPADPPNVGLQVQQLMLPGMW